MPCATGPRAGDLSARRPKWASRFAIERRLTLTDAQLVLAALATLPGEGAKAGAEALIELAERHKLNRIDQLLTSWLERHGLGV